MEIICYLPASPHGADLLNRLRLSLDTTALEVFDSLPFFINRLLRPSQGGACLLLAPADQGELDMLISQIDLLRDSPLVLVLPDLLSPTLAKAHRLRPRFLTDRQGDAEEVTRVLERMVGRIRQDQDGRQLRQILGD